MTKKLLFFSLIAVFAFVFLAAKKEGEKNQFIYNEMNRLEKQAADLEQEKQNLADLIAFFDTKSYAEREAKKQLGLQNPGEKVIVITRSDESVAEAIESVEEKKESNLRKWLDYIFGVR